MIRLTKDLLIALGLLLIAAIAAWHIGCSEFGPMGETFNSSHAAFRQVTQPIVADYSDRVCFNLILHSTPGAEITMWDGQEATVIIWDLREAEGKWVISPALLAHGVGHVLSFKDARFIDPDRQAGLQ